MKKEIKVGTTIVNRSKHAGKTLVRKESGREFYCWKSATVTSIGKLGPNTNYYTVVDDRGLPTTIDDDDFKDGHLVVEE